MAVKKPKTNSHAKKSSPAKANGKPRSYRQSILHHLSAVPGVDAAYCWVDSRKVVHVVSVIEDFKSEIFDHLMPKESLVEKAHPRVFFDFHVHVRQERTVDETVPSGVTLVFKK